MSCKHTITRGDNKGKQCSTKPRNGEFCNKHNKAREEYKREYYIETKDEVERCSLTI